jgi:hypothetical protein
MDANLAQMLSNARRLAEAETCIWLLVWSLRRRADLDERLDRAAHAIRWLIAIGGWILLSIPGPTLGPLRAIAGVMGLAFLCWPNFAYHLLRLLRRRRAV